MKSLSNLLKKSAVILLASIAVLFAGLSIYALWPVKEVDPMVFADSRDRFITVNGVNLRYVEAGDVSNPPIVLVHGFAGSVYTFRKILPILSAEYHVVALDLPGFGLSDKPSDYDYGYPNQGKTVADFIEALNLKDCALAGHSMGGNIVLYTAEKQPAVSKLILMDPGIIDDGNPDFLKYLFFPLTRISAKMFRSEDFRMTSFKSSYLHPEDITQQDIDNYMIASKTDNFVNAITQMLKTYEDPAELPLVPQAKIPVLLLWGDSDKGNPPENGKVLDQKFPDSSLEIIRNSGHYIHEEQPEQTAEAIVRFLGS